ncbi:MAG TPA: hypothetical protein VJK52_04125 [Candidatus Nanoarchaeia archaeon]|nr:hypothetical protein [Candidatus Nanoarchaeia archaeon]
MELILVGAAVIAALASPLRLVIVELIQQKAPNPLRRVWEIGLLFFSMFGMLLLCGMVFLILFRKLTILWPFSIFALPLVICGLFFLDTTDHLTIFPDRQERRKWYRMIASEQHTMALGSLTILGELFTSGTPLLLAALWLSRNSPFVFEQFRPVLWYAGAFTVALGLSSIWRRSARIWQVLLSIIVLFGTVAFFIYPY